MYLMISNSKIVFYIEIIFHPLAKQKVIRNISVVYELCAKLYFQSYFSGVSESNIIYFCYESRSVTILCSQIFPGHNMYCYTKDSLGRKVCVWHSERFSPCGMYNM